MLFNSYSFLFAFLPVTLPVFLAIRRRSLNATIAWLALVSFVFYSFAGPQFTMLLLVSVLANFSIGRRISAARRQHRDKSARLWAGIGVALNLAALGYWKYADFAISSFAHLTGGSYELLRLTLPVGISFFTFTQIAFLVDVAKGRADEYHLIDYMLFVSWFPHLIAGPIMHHREVMPQFRRPRDKADPGQDLAVGFSVFAIGLAKKTLVADHFAQFADPVFASAAAGSSVAFFQAWSGALAYTFQLYFDFSGYSDMAIGLSLMFGVRLPVNFDSPYKAASLIDFWRRWHMTLSRFLRDYVYVPLGGNRHGRERQLLAIMATMVLGGLWHGAAWTFFAWGAFHGALLCVNHAWRWMRPAASLTNQQIWLSRVLVFMAVVVGWVLFRADSLHSAMSFLRGMAGSHGRGPMDRWLVLQLAATLAVVWWMPNTQEIFARFQPVLSTFGKAWQTGRMQWSAQIRPAIATSLLLALSILSLGQVSPFLYFRF